jgi:predicted phage terminase large subunit-like protein
MDLWQRWEELLLNHGGEPHEAEAAAHAFYAKHQAQMDRGAQVSWPAMRPLEKLMLIRARDGHEAFDAELQNDPVSSLDAVFADMQFWVNRLDQWVFYGACDPSLGRRGNQRDPSAIGVGGLNRETGVLDVVEALIAKRLPDRIISDIIELQREYLCLAWAIEAVQFQEFLRTELIKRSAAAGVPVPAIAVTPNADKDLRIESLQPHVKNGLIRLHPSQTTLIAQLRHWPKADHDDGPDMLQMLWALAVSRVPAAGATKLDPMVRRAHDRTRRTMGLMFGRRAA